MKTLVISDYDLLPLHISESIKHFGDVRFVTTRDIKDDISINVSSFNNRLTWLKDAIRSFAFRKIILNVDKRYSFFQDIDENSNYYNARSILRKVEFIPDVIIILFDYRLLTTNTIQDIYNITKAKIFWMIPDMKPMTGGCSYSADCLEYQESCLKCPAIKNSFTKNFANITLKKKVNNLKNVDITIITGSTYQYDQAKKSKIFSNKKIEKIYFPSSEEYFHFKDKKLARKELGIVTSKKIILLGASSLSEERKGMKYGIEALEKLSKSDKNNLLLLVVGNGEMEELSQLDIEILNLGYVNYLKLSLAYQAADLFICPTIDDSGPVMVSQSILCGTPVVSFKMGISVDLVVNGKTGYICTLKKSDELSKGISIIINNSDIENEIMQNNCLELSHELNFKNFQTKIFELINN